MSDFMLGLLALPAGALTLVGLYLVWRLLEWGYAETMIWKPRFNNRVYAYKIKSVEQGGTRSADGMIGGTIIERRNLGPTYTYRISLDGVSHVTLNAERLPGGGRFRTHQQNVDWDDETVTRMDEHL